MQDYVLETYFAICFLLSCARLCFGHVGETLRDLSCSQANVVLIPLYAP